MYIRELELSGFKSFVSKVRLEFTPGLTAIVGPNGSGKSNLVDAVRWVLGEQNSRLLRAERMEEVIFNGTRRLKPLGRAEVSLTIDNSDGVLPLAYQEVRLTRRLYRSGEAEYLLNQAPCRLRDIQQLLWDTGVGKHGFAIIGQGEVEEFLTASPEERRSLLEEVAGIVRYRHRRREAEQKLAETKGHLLRLRDIVAELEAQLASLEGEVEVAKRYQALQEEITSLERELSFWRLRTLEQRRGELTARLSRLEAELEKLEEQGQLLQEEIETRKQELALLAGEREAGRAARQKAAAARREAEVKREAKTQELRFLAEEEERLARELNELAVRWQQVEEEIGRNEAELSKLALERQELEAKNREVSKALAAAEEELKGAIRRREERRAELHNLWQSILANQKELRALEAEWQAAKARGQRLHAERQRLQEEKDKVARELAGAEERVKAASAQLGEIEAGFSKLKEALGACRHELAHLQEAIENLQQSWQRDKNRLAVLREWQQAYEGYSQAVKAVLAARRQLWPDDNGLVGVVAELLKVPPELETAIEAALGGALQYIVTRAESDAQRAIAYLKASGAGRATFLPLEAIQPRKLPVDRSVLNWAGVVGVGAELVEAPKDCAAILPYLLGDLLVVTKLDLALSIARRLGYRVRIVTLEGDLLHPGGSLTGGSSKGRSGRLLSRLREIGELAAKVDAEFRELAALREEEKILKARLAAYEAEEKSLQEKLWAARADLTMEEGERRELGRRMTTLEEHLAVVNLDLGRWEEEFRLLTKRRDALENHLSELQEAQEALAQREQQPDDGYREVEARRARLLAAAEEGRGRQAMLQQREDRLRGSLLGLYELKARYRKQKAEQDERLKDLEERARALRWVQENLGHEVERLRQQEEMLEQQLAAVEARFQEAEIALREREQELSQVLARRRSVEKNYQQVRLEAGEVEASHRAQAEWLEQQYGWQREQGIPTLSAGEEELKTLLAAKRQEKEQLGPVDLSVLAEYNRLQERRRYFVGQAEDLESAQASLNRAVVEVEKLMEERLAASLSAVNERLAQVFPALFGGGKAWLAPTGNGRLLDGGLEVVVQLPGKRIPNLALLSGGERALAAISVLFALLQVKPSPFCLLDEIDASLDEANVGRFARFLRELSARQQFIVVSHRAGTVEQADSVYGVTMEEEGVSRLVSLRLPRAEEETAGQKNAG